MKAKPVKALYGKVFTAPLPEIFLRSTTGEEKLPEEEIL